MTDPRGTSDLLAQGIAAAKAGQKDQAKEILLQALKLDERNELAWLRLSGVLYTLEEKRICPENVLAINPGNTRAQAGLDHLRQAQPSAPEVQERCPRCSAAIPSSATACPHCDLPLIVACPHCGEYASIEEATCRQCGQALGDFRLGAAYHLGLARLYLQQQKVDRTREALARASAEAAGDPDLLAQVGAAYEAIHRPGPAIEAYEQALERSPADPILHARLANLYRRQGDTDRAQAMYERAAQLGGKDPAVIYELARLHMEADGSPEEAIVLLQGLVAKQRLDARAYLLLGDAYRRLGNVHEAAKNYQWAVKFSTPDSIIGLEAQRKLAEVQAPFQDQGGGGGSGMVRRGARPQRPGCVTFYAILLAIGAAMNLLGGLCLLPSLATGQQPFQESLLTMNDSMLAAGQAPILGAEQMANLSQIMSIAVWVGLAWALGTAVVNGLLAFGLWTLRNWARLGVIAIGILSILATFAQAAWSVTTMRDALSAMSGMGGQGLPPTVATSFVCPVVLVVLIQSYIIFWFYANRDVFDQ